MLLIDSFFTSTECAEIENVLKFLLIIKGFGDSKMAARGRKQKACSLK
jgi:hypothetical protein